MSVLQFLIFLAVSFGASTVGAICGLGGGADDKYPLQNMIFRLSGIRNFY